MSDVSSKADEGGAGSVSGNDFTRERSLLNGEVSVYNYIISQFAFYMQLDRLGYTIIIEFL